MHSGLSNLCGMLSFESTFYGAPPVSEAARREAERVLAVWSSELARHGGPYLAGELSLADLTFVPVIRRFQKRGITFDAWPHVAAWAEPHVAAWAERMMSRPSVVEWMHEAEALPPVILDEP
jgi:glutathione S-transferase